MMWIGIIIIVLLSIIVICLLEKTFGGVMDTIELILSAILWICILGGCAFVLIALVGIFYS